MSGNLPDGIRDPGDLPEMQECPHCGGTGLLTDEHGNEYEEPCPFCTGQGYIEPEGPDDEYDADEEEARRS